LTPGSGIWDLISESLETILWVKIPQFFDADPDQGSGIWNLFDPGWKKFGSWINIPDPQLCMGQGSYDTVLTLSYSSTKNAVIYP
jgi:hypothetical protein